MTSSTSIVVGALALTLAGTAAANAESTASESTRVDAAPRFMVSLGVGPGYLGGTDSSQASASRLAVGYRLRQFLLVTFQGDLTSFGRYAADPTMTRQVSVASLGARLTPFAEPPTGDEHLNVRNVQLQLSLGVAHEILSPYDSFGPFAVDNRGWGPSLGASFAWHPFLGHAWSAGVEVMASYEHLERWYWTERELLVFNLHFGHRSGSSDRPITASAK